MDDSFQELEAELKSLQPRRAGTHLLEGIRHELASPQIEVTPAVRPRYATATNLNSWKWLGWRTAGLATAVAVVAVFTLVTLKQPSPQAASMSSLAATGPAVQPQPATSMRDDRYQPVAATNVLYDLKDEGLVNTEDDTAARRVRYRYLDTYTWKNPKTNASLKWSVPRDEIRLVSASLN
jgi:hypothetical protein